MKQRIADKLWEEIEEKMLEAEENTGDRILTLLTESRMEGLEKVFLEKDKENQKQEKRILELEEQVKKLILPKNLYKLDEYVSEMNSQWLEYSEFAYQCGVKDILSLLQHDFEGKQSK